MVQRHGKTANEAVEFDPWSAIGPWLVPPYSSTIEGRFIITRTLISMIFDSFESVNEIVNGTNKQYAAQIIVGA
jgi:hypothetical protein